MPEEGSFRIKNKRQAQKNSNVLIAGTFRHGISKKGSTVLWDIWN
jgi:hypothetical protein